MGRQLWNLRQPSMSVPALATSVSASASGGLASAPVSAPGLASSYSSTLPSRASFSSDPDIGDDGAERDGDDTEFKDARSDQLSPGSSGSFDQFGSCEGSTMGSTDELYADPVDPGAVSGLSISKSSSSAGWEPANDDEDGGVWKVEDVVPFVSMSSSSPVVSVEEDDLWTDVLW